LEGAPCIGEIVKRITGDRGECEFLCIKPKLRARVEEHIKNALVVGNQDWCCGVGCLVDCGMNDLTLSLCAPAFLAKDEGARRLLLGFLRNTHEKNQSISTLEMLQSKIPRDSPWGAMFFSRSCRLRMTASNGTSFSPCLLH
jgi:hypothetical protein